MALRVTIARYKDIDSVYEWPEVKRINGYAALLGCLTMAVRGLGFLVLTWTTVVLLGGFVSILQKKDFWCLTVITFIQIGRVVDVVVSEKINSLGYSGQGLGAVWKVFLPKQVAPPARLTIVRRAVSLIKLLLGLIMWLVQLLAYTLVFYGAILALYFSGLLITTGISLWRLIQHDYGSSDGDPDKANMKPALVALYCLVVVQGVIMIYKVFLMSVRGKIVNQVAKEYGFKDYSVTIVAAYLDEIQRGCHKDPSFAKGRNLITYVVDLMVANKSVREYHAGTRILGTLLRTFPPVQSERFYGQGKLIKQLISSRHVLLQQLLQMLGPTNHAYDRATRNCVAMIVAHVADDIRLEQFPGGIQCISSLVETFQDWYLRDWNGQAHLVRLVSDEHDSILQSCYKDLLLKGLCILWKLADDESNRIVMSNTQGLLHKIMAPVTSNLLHRVDHRAWSQIVDHSMMVMHRFVTAPGNTRPRLCREITSNKEAISTMERILNCRKCHVKTQKHAMTILAQASMHCTSSSPSLDITESRGKFIKTLVDIFTDDNRDISIRKLAGEKLVMLSSQGGENVAIILQVKNYSCVVDTLTELLLDVTQDYSYRTSAAETLEHLCIHYTKNDDYLKKLKEPMIDMLPEVLKLILHRGCTSEETAAGGGGTEAAWLVEREDDIENQCDDPQNDTRGKSSSLENIDLGSQDGDEQDDKDEAEDFEDTLLSLYATACDKLITAKQDLAHAVGPIDTSSFASKLKGMVEKHRHLMPKSLTALKVISKMVIWMTKHSVGYVIFEDLESLMESLSSASEYMLLIDGSMVFHGDDDKAAAEPVKTLASLLEEARELLDKRKAQELEATPANLGN